MRTRILPIALIALAGSAQAQTIEMLGSLGGSGSIARDINDLGQIVGESLLAGDAVAHATIWNNGIASDLGGLSAGDNSVAWAINNLGVAVGPNDLSTGERTAALFQGGSVTNLGATIGSQGNSVAWDINDAGVVVGQAPINPGFAKGFVWDPTNGAQAAGTIPGYMGGANPDSDFVNLTQATGVNAHGDIVGFGETRSGELAGFVIKGFVPAPGTGVLLAAAGLIASRRRRDNH